MDINIIFVIVINIVIVIVIVVNGYPRDPKRPCGGESAPLNFSLPSSHQKGAEGAPEGGRGAPAAGGGGGLYRPYSTSPTPHRSIPGTESIDGLMD